MSGWKGLWKNVTGKKSTEKKADKGITVEGIEKDEDDIVTSVSKIASILGQAADDQTLVEIAFGSRILVYKTRILLDLDTDPGGAGGTEPSSEYLSKGEYMLISSIDPPEGNDKLRSAGMATLQFAQGNKFNEFHARFLETKMLGDSEDGGGTPSYKLEFPQTIFRKQQRRASARFKVPEKAMVLLTVERPALVTFRALILDLGTGGLSFAQPGDIAPLTENCHLKLKLNCNCMRSTWETKPSEREVNIPGTLIKNKVSLGKTRVHVSFAVESYEMSRELGELVSHVERMQLQDKKQ